jgi:hypothetical protein
MAPMVTIGNLPRASRRSRYRWPKQTVAIPLAPVSLIKGHHGWHVQSLAQARMADLGQARLAIDARARLVLAGIEAGKSLHRAGIVKARRLTEKASKVAMVRSPKPGAVEQVAFIFEIGIIVDEGMDRLDQLIDLVVQPGNMLDDAVTDVIAGDLKRRLPGRRRHGTAEVRNQRSHQLSQSWRAPRASCQTP